VRWNVTVRRTDPAPEIETTVAVEAQKGWDALRMAVTKVKKIEGFSDIEPEDVFVWIVPVVPVPPKQTDLFEV